MRGKNTNNAKEKIILPIGPQKALVYAPTSGDKQEQRFIEQCNAVVTTRPESIQDFFIRLADLQRNQ